jgi:hypothetical protein
MMGSCEHGNETSDSIKCWEFLDWVGGQLLASQEDLNSMESVSQLISVNSMSQFP